MKDATYAVTKRKLKKMGVPGFELLFCFVLFICHTVIEYINNIR